MSDTHRSRRERVEPSIYRRLDASGHTRFEIQYRDSDGKQRWETLPPDTTKTAARVALADVRARKGRGERVRPNPKLRFGEAASRWWDGQAAKLRPATQSAYSASLTRLRDRWERSRLDDISVAMVADYISELERSYKGWTIKGDLTVLGRVFDYSIRHLAWAGTNPVRGLDKSERPKSDEKPKRILSADELARLLRAVDDHYRLLFEFAAATGCRLGETLGLRWHGLDLDRGIVHISHQLDRASKYVELKTSRSRRTIELPPTLVSRLRAHKLRSPFGGEHDYVFTSRKGTGHDHRNIGGRVMARAVARARLEAELRDGEVVKPAPTFHSLRHSHGSALIAEGWDIEEVSARLGHRDSGVTHRVYIHAYESAQRSAARADRLEAMYGESVGQAAETVGGNGCERGSAVPTVASLASRRAPR